MDLNTPVTGGQMLHVAFYMFTPMAPLSGLENTLRHMCEERELTGSVIVAYEGINGMLAGEPERVEGFLEALMALRPALDVMPVKRSWTDRQPFKKLAVKIKPEIVTMREQGVDAIAKTGTHLPPKEFRRWLREGEEMVLVDVRNDFECQLGTFKGAINPKTTSFHQFPEVVRAQAAQWKRKKVVMFCTGGIRCEKVSSWMLDQGFDEVFQLEGGIIHYFEEVEDAQEDWEGELFVFDERVALDTKLQETGTTIEDVDRLMGRDA